MDQNRNELTNMFSEKIKDGSKIDYSLPIMACERLLAGWLLAVERLAVEPLAVGSSDFFDLETK